MKKNLNWIWAIPFGAMLVMFGILIGYNIPDLRGLELASNIILLIAFPSGIMAALLPLLLLNNNS